MQPRVWTGVPPSLEPHALFSTSEPASAERLGSPFLGRHRLLPRADDRGGFCATVHAVVLGPVALARLHLVTEVDLEVAATAPRFLVVVPTTGATEVRTGCSAFEATPERALVIQPGRPATVHCPAGSAHLVLGIDRPTLLLHLSRLLGRALDRPLELDPELNLGSATASRWNLAVEMLHAELSERGSLLESTIGQVQLEEFLMSSLLYGHRSTYSEILSRPGPAAERRAIASAKRFIEAHLAERLSVAAVAAAAGVSPRTLQAAFHSELGTTPTAYIRTRRLDRARADLAAARGTTVTDVAVRWGISHLGRFAVEYRSRFGESPSETLRQHSPT